ncbi:MAG: HypC/HybG/HupF family hydrogenase formation chaperone [Coriobacteriia bacterium]|nr:HypC/HybG/HupF family hydrogenase formation chaperone [Coriobacteriia bacterium]
MCLAIPAKVVLIGENRIAQVDIHGVTRTVSLDLVPDAEMDSWVLVHAGFAIQVVDEEFAAESWALIQEMGEALDAEDAALLEASAQAAQAAATTTSDVPA